LFNDIKLHYATRRSRLLAVCGTKSRECLVSIGILLVPTSLEYHVVDSSNSAVCPEGRPYVRRTSGGDGIRPHTDESCSDGSHTGISDDSRERTDSHGSGSNTDCSDSSRSHGSYSPTDCSCRTYSPTGPSHPETYPFYDSTFATTVPTATRPTATTPATLAITPTAPTAATPELSARRYRLGAPQNYPTTENQNDNQP